MDYTVVKNTVLNEEYYHKKHKSGLQIFVVPKKEFSKSYAIISTKYGSVDSKFIASNHEVTVPDGIAHFLEHKLFEGSDGKNAFDKFSNTGASANAYTSFNNTAYLFSCTDKFDENLDILLGFVTDPYFTDENVSKEQGIIAQEIRMYDDDPHWRVYFNLISSLYKENPVRKDIAGDIESISKIDKELLYTCYKSFYHPANMVLCVVGNADLKIVDEIVNKYYNQFNAEDFTVARQQIDEPKIIEKRETTKKMPVSTPLFLVGFKDIQTGLFGNELLKRELTINILLKMLFGRSSKLYDELYREGLINESFTFEGNVEKEYSFVLMGGESEDPYKATEHILRYIDHIRFERLSPEDFSRCKNSLFGSFIKSFNRVEKIANMFVSNFFNGVDHFEFLNMADEITIFDVEKCFEDIFSDERMALSVIEKM